MALQALSLYSESTAGNPLDLRVKLTSEKDADWEESKIHITEDNALLRRQIDVRAVNETAALFHIPIKSG